MRAAEISVKRHFQRFRRRSCTGHGHAQRSIRPQVPFIIRSHCNGCSTNLERMLGKREGVLSASVSLEDATAQVEYDEARVDLEGLREVVENCGFDVVE